MADDLPARAAAAHADGERLAREGLPDAALVRLLDAVALHPELPNARNHAGYLLTTRHRHEPEALARGIDLLRDAHAADPGAITPLANLVEALAAADRRAEAIELLAGLLAARPEWAEAWNLSGWLRGLADGADDPAGAIADLTRAVQLQHWYGDALFNLGRLAQETGDSPGALAAFRAALASGRCWKPAEARLHLATLEEQRGRLRVALGLYRTAAQAALSAEHGALVHAGVQRCGHALLAADRYLLHALDEARRSHLHPDPPPRLRRLAHAARALLPRCSTPDLTAARDALQIVIECCDVRDLPARHADRSPTTDLQLAAAARATAPDLAADLRDLAALWAAAQRSLYDDLLVREEPDPDDAASPRGRLFTAAAHRRWPDVLPLLEPLGLSLDRAWLAEHLGLRARRDDEPFAAPLLRLALEDQLALLPHAGREGGERADDIRRIEAWLRGDD